MEYNTQAPKLKIPEYGRNIQKMIDYSLSLEDREDRNRAVHTIIQVMGNLNPSLKENRDYRHKLWDHLYIMSDFKLDVDAPFDPPSVEELQTQPSKVPYPQSKIRFQHYGKIAELLIHKAIQMPDSEQKTEFVRHIANHMKISYFSWNKDAVNDQIILEALKEISDGQLKLPSDTVLMEVKEPVYKPAQQQKKRRSKGGHKR